MKTVILSCLLVCIALPQIILAASPSKPFALNHLPAKHAYIVSFHVETEGALHIIYSDGAEIEVPLERGRFDDGKQTLTQANFSDVQVADVRQHIGWLADYRRALGTPFRYLDLCFWFHSYDFRDTITPFPEDRG